MSDDTESGTGGAPTSGGGDGRSGPAGRGRRHERLNRHATPGPLNSLQHWREAKSIPQVVYNYLFVLVARLAPALPVKAWALRRLGVTVGDGVSWGLEATPAVFWPELVTLEDHVIAVVLPGVEVGAGAQVAANSLVAEDVPAGETWAGVPAKPVDGEG